MGFPERLKRLREVRGLTQREVGAAVGRDAQSISRMELGKIGVATDTLLRLATFFETTPEYLIEGVEPAKGTSPPVAFARVADAGDAADRLDESDLAALHRFLGSGTHAPVSDAELEELRYWGRTSYNRGGLRPQDFADHLETYRRLQRDAGEPPADGRIATGTRRKGAPVGDDVAAPAKGKRQKKRAKPGS